MRAWLRSAGVSISTAALALLALWAAMSYARQKNQAQEWRDKAVAIEEGNVVKGVETAEAANTQAALHNARAEERNEKATARITQIGEKNEPMADILDNWRKS